MLSLLRCPFVQSRSRAAGRTRLAALVLSAVVVGGCATGEYAFVTRVSTGERIQIPIKNGAPLHAKSGTIEIAYVGVQPGLSPENKDKHFIYYFLVWENSGKAPRSIRVEDISDEKAVLMLEDLAPKLSPLKRWGAATRPYTAADPDMHWVSYVDDSMRVFRFTIINSEGQKIVLDQGWYLPTWAKATIRKALGMGNTK
jgi:hypothetical protein